MIRPDVIGLASCATFCGIRSQCQNGDDRIRAEIAWNKWRSTRSNGSSRGQGDFGGRGANGSVCGSSRVETTPKRMRLGRFESIHGIQGLNRMPATSGFDPMISRGMRRRAVTFRCRMGGLPVGGRDEPNARRVLGVLGGSTGRSFNPCVLFFRPSIAKKKPRGTPRGVWAVQDSNL
jgi:hypothetical protein